mmetsp:Transcript_13823/g.27136  ORF Transcript_13823/g.27136 Transcript_13823/m.27136 type:complete len:110 (+) Transcript_13823:1152-1481(+)
MMKQESATKIGMNVRDLVLGSVARMMNLSVNTYNPAPMKPATTGDRTHESAIPPRPPIDQSRQAPEVPARVMPTTPPTMACVPETGAELNVARSRNTLLPTSAPNMPTA